MTADRKRLHYTIARSYAVQVELEGTPLGKQLALAAMFKHLLIALRIPMESEHETGNS